MGDFVIIFAIYYYGLQSVSLKYSEQELEDL